MAVWQRQRRAVAAAAAAAGERTARSSRAAPPTQPAAVHSAAPPPGSSLAPGCRRHAAGRQGPRSRTAATAGATMASGVHRDAANLQTRVGVTPQFSAGFSATFGERARQLRRRSPAAGANAGAAERAANCWTASATAMWPQDDASWVGSLLHRGDGESASKQARACTVPTRARHAQHPRGFAAAGGRTRRA